METDVAGNTGTPDSISFQLIRFEPSNEIPQGIFDIIAKDLGKHVLENLFKVHGIERLNQMIELLSKNILEYCKSPTHSRLIQELIAFIAKQNQIHLLEKLFNRHFVELATDENGYRVILTLLEVSNDTTNQSWFDLINENLVHLSSDQYGCCLIQKSLNYTSSAQKKQIINQVIVNTIGLIQNPFGNYLVQHVLSFGIEYPYKVIKKTKGKIISYSRQKYSSNVIEKCMQHGDEQTIKIVAEEFLRVVGTPKKILCLLIDSYANYVIQSLLIQSKEKIQKRI